MERAEFKIVKTTIIPLVKSVIESFKFKLPIVSKIDFYSLKSKEAISPELKKKFKKIKMRGLSRNWCIVTEHTQHTLFLKLLSCGGV